VLPHFSKIRGWVKDRETKVRTLAEVQAMKINGAELERARNLYYRVSYAIEKDQQYQDREVRAPHRG